LNDAKLAEDEEYFDDLGNLRTRDSEKNVANITKQMKDEEDFRKKKKELAISAAESISGAFFQIQENQLKEETDAAISALDKEFAERKKLAGDNKIELARIDKEYEKKKAAIERDAAEKSAKGQPLRRP